MPPAAPPDKICPTCGRPFAWRRKWAREWDRVRYCGAACRRRAGSGTAAAVDAGLESAILELLARRPRGHTICPSEAARAVAPDGWRDLMQPARAAARRLTAAGRLEVVQTGRAVDPATAKGPIRLRLKT